MRWHWAFCVVSGLLSGPASAEAYRFRGDAIAACVDAAEGAACIGRQTERCIAVTRGFTVNAMTACSFEEIALPQDGLARMLEAERDFLRALDARAHDCTARECPSGVKVLDGMENAWRTYREARCRYDTVSLRGTPDGGTVLAGCVLQMTGEQVLSLRLGDGG